MESSRRKHIFFVKSSDSLNVFPENSANDFTIELPEQLYLKGEWQCALHEIAFRDDISQDIVVGCDMVDNSIIADSKHQVLRVISRRNSVVRYVSFSELLWIPVSRDQIKRFRIVIKDEQLRLATFLSGEVTCTVEIRKTNI